MDEVQTSGVTLKVLQDLQTRYKVSASKALGQNFLIDTNISRKIAQTIDGQNHVIEVGPGIGSLTVPLARHAKKVSAIELDQHIIEPLRDVLNQFDLLDDVEIINSDVMKLDLEKLCNENEIETVIGNLPYNISAPLLADIARKVPSVNVVVAMVQKEVGERLAANLGTRSVSSISLKVQYFMDVQLLFAVPKQSFIPRPRVDSVVLRMDRKQSDPFGLDSFQIDAMSRIIDSAFAGRRKMMRQSLKSLFGARSEEIFQLAQVESSLRPEKCQLDDFVRLFRASETLLNL